MTSMRHWLSSQIFLCSFLLTFKTIRRKEGIVLMTDKKTNGQYMTPDGIVSMILNSIGYINEHVLTKTIMEPSFGDGAFLINIVQRIISEGTKAGKTKVEIQQLIQTNLYGIEKDEALYKKAIERLNSLLTVYEIPEINWSANLHCGDTLLLFEAFEGKMDYVVGNPPYVRIHNIPEEYRETVKHFKFIDGMIDLYIVFYEIGILMLNEKGKLGYISPNSFMKNTSQRKFRNYLVDNKYISAIYDFKTSKIFPDADAYTCICILNKNMKRVDFSIDYKEYSMYSLVVENKFSYNYFKEQLQDNSWNLSSEEDIKFLEKNKNLPIKINNMAIVQNGIATNKDSAYVIHVFDDKDLSIPYMGKHTDKKKLVFFKDKTGQLWEIESTMLHRCVKASKFNGTMDNTYIVFPYEKTQSPKFFSKKTGIEIESGYTPLTEDKFKKVYPKAYQYLSSLWDELITRDMDKNSSWFLFGRSQGLQNSCFKKIVFKHIIEKNNPQIIPYILDEDVIVYSGMYTTIDINIIVHPKYKSNGEKESDKYIFDEAMYDYALKDVYKILSSNDFAKYCAMVGKDMSGGYVGISTKMVKLFGTTLNTFPTFPVTIPTEDLSIADNNYMNKLFQKEFINCIKKAYINMGASGKTSTKRVEPFHSFLAKVLQYKLGTDYDVYAAGYSYGKECTLGGNFDNKNVDVCVKKNGKEIGAIAFKLLSNNFKQNNKNFIESMLGEAVQMRSSGLPYAFCYLIPEKALYLSKTGLFDHIDNFTQTDLKVYYDICVDESYKNRTPDALFVGLHKLFSEEYIASLSQGEKIDINSKEYLDAIQPEWSNYDYISDEDIKEYFLENSNIGLFLDNFIKAMLK